MLHIHFGAGRLGLGLIAPFFRCPDSNLFILNRSAPDAHCSENAPLSSVRRNRLLSDNPYQFYKIKELDTVGPYSETVKYDGFLEYSKDNIRSVIEAVLERSTQKRDGVIVTASIWSLAHYGPVTQALLLLADLSERRSLGPVTFIACENEISARDVLADREFCRSFSDEVRRHITCVLALVDRVCVALEEDDSEQYPTLRVRAEKYGSLKLELRPETRQLASKLQESRVGFTRYVAIERQIKSWLLNGSHSLIALSALEASGGNRNLKLSKFLGQSPQHVEFASTVMKELCEGILFILQSEEQYSEFVHDVDPAEYLRGAAAGLLSRFLSNEDPISRILSRFQAPSAEVPSTIEVFTERLARRVSQPLDAYAAKKGFAPPAVLESFQNLTRLIASGTFIGTA